MKHTGPGCSSLGYGAFEELGPFRVNSDGKTLYRNQYAWNEGKTIMIINIIKKEISIMHLRDMNVLPIYRYDIYAVANILFLKLQNSTICFDISITVFSMLIINVLFFMTTVVILLLTGMTVQLLSYPPSSISLKATLNYGYTGKFDFIIVYSVNNVMTI